MSCHDFLCSASSMAIINWNYLKRVVQMGRYKGGDRHRRDRHPRFRRPVHVILVSFHSYSRVNRTSRIVSLDPPTEEDDVETPAEEACRKGLMEDTSRGARTWKDIINIYASESRWENLVKGIRSGKVLPAWERPKRRWWGMKRKD